MGWCSLLAATPRWHAATTAPGVHHATQSGAERHDGPQIRTLKEQCVHRLRFETPAALHPCHQRLVGFYNTGGLTISQPRHLLNAPRLLSYRGGN